MLFLLILSAFLTIYPIYNYIKSSFAKLLFYEFLSRQFFIEELVKRRIGLRNKYRQSFIEELVKRSYRFKNKSVYISTILGGYVE